MRRAIVASMCFSSILLVNGGIDMTHATPNGIPDYDKIHLDGCPVRLSPTCLMVLDKRGTPFEISSAPARSEPRGSKAAPPSPDRGLSISLDGVVAEGKIGMCKRGVQLTDIRWHYTKEKCRGASALR